MQKQVYKSVIPLENVRREFAVHEDDDLAILGGKTDLAMYKYSLEFNPEVTEKMVQEAETAKKTVALHQEKPEGKKRGRKKKAEEEAPEVLQVSDADESDGEQVQIICNRISGHFVDIMCDLQEEPQATEHPITLSFGVDANASMGE